MKTVYCTIQNKNNLKKNKNEGNCNKQTLVLNKNGTNSEFISSPIASQPEQGKNYNCVMIIQIPLTTAIDLDSNAISKPGETNPICICGRQMELISLSNYKAMILKRDSNVEEKKTESSNNSNSNSNSHSTFEVPICDLCQQLPYNILSNRDEKAMTNLWYCPATSSDNRVHSYKYTLCQDCGNQQVSFCCCLFSYCFVLQFILSNS